MFDRKGDEERSMGVRSSSGETLGASPHLNNNKQKQIYMYLRKKVKQRDRRYIHTYLYTYYPNSELQRDLIKSKMKDYLLKNPIKQIKLPKA